MVFAAKGNRPDGALHRVGIELDAAVVEEPAEGWPASEGITDGIGQAAARRNAMQFGLEPQLDQQVSDLPYGKRRLLAIARAVATRPSVLLLDEPAAGLGDVETVELANLVKGLARDWGIAVLLVEHDMTFVMSVCDELVVLDFGRKIAQGSPEEIRSDPAVIAAYLGDAEYDEVSEELLDEAQTQGRTQAQTEKAR